MHAFTIKPAKKKNEQNLTEPRNIYSPLSSTSLPLNWGKFHIMSAIKMWHYSDTFVTLIQS